MHNNTMDRIFRQRKFVLALIFTFTGIAALFLGFLTGGEFIMLVGLILGLYGAANVAEYHVTGEPGNEYRVAGHVGLDTPSDEVER